MADEDISLTEDQLLDNLDDTNNGDSEFLIEVNNSIHFPQFQIIPDNYCIRLFDVVATA